MTPVEPPERTDVERDFVAIQSVMGPTGERIVRRLRQRLRRLEAERDYYQGTGPRPNPPRRKLCNRPKHYLGIPCPNEPECSWGD